MSEKPDALDKMKTASGELVRESPIAKIMLNIGQIIAEKGEDPIGVRHMKQRFNKTVFIRELNTQWDASNTRIISKTELGIMEEGELKEGFAVVWSTIFDGQSEIKRTERTSPSIIVELVSRTPSSEKEKGRPPHTNTLVSFMKSGQVIIQVDPLDHEVSTIDGMKKVGDIYQYYGPVNNVPSELEAVVLPVLTSIQERLASKKGQEKLSQLGTGQGA
ncbi:hypothetical protein A2363_01615 [Candidatus Gottesmanbacteria bacterium RIFOXYB1_FULL_47_11]|uniref:Uncharacterized protein n=1 Tax=Candidatus Gottesmanbacteria bacterium RIFOXYB1_FULL_47_11 TaxID=1798401 RepID=A0A1F6BG50_9BACT|nr:MAG: hypothetical protein A2363_01615 [Candidatus Gottesmanbacteria bacterium RIFOXYB1_FULL_47_11]